MVVVSLVLADIVGFPAPVPCMPKPQVFFVVSSLVEHRDR